MAAKDREDKDALIQTFLRNKRDFSFFQLVHLIESYFTKSVPLGYSGPAEGEKVRFCHTPSLSFPSADVEKIEKLNENYVITTSFLGVIGIVSPLPNFYCEEVLWNDENEDIVKKFLDIFHHRLICLLYRTWSKYRYYIRYKKGAHDTISQHVFSLFGFGTAHLFDSMQLPPVNLLRYAGLFLQKPGSASGLENILTDYLDGIKVTITQCVGRWLTISENQKVVLGNSNCLLGESFSIGERVYDTSGKFRITIGPMGFKKFSGLLPNRQKHTELVELIRLYLTNTLDFDIELILKYDEIPEFSLSSTSPACTLGWTSIFKDSDGRDMALVI
jgi:type VI secretion system protein ImpH